MIISFHFKKTPVPENSRDMLLLIILGFFFFLINCWQVKSAETFMGRENSISQQNYPNIYMPLRRSVLTVKTQQVRSCHPKRVIRPNSLKTEIFRDHHWNLSLKEIPRTEIFDLGLLTLQFSCGLVVSF